MRLAKLGLFCLFYMAWGLWTLYMGIAMLAADIDQRGRTARLNGTWDQVCTQAAGYRLGDPCSASRWCRENRFNEAFEDWLTGGSYDGTHS